jgi:ribosomal protein L40E
VASIFRPFGEKGFETVRCPDEKCNALNPPEAKFCWVCGRKLRPSMPKEAETDA